MAENIPNMPTGAVPPKPAEAAKIQPKKETVRINLPPKPTAAPTIKIPSPAAISAAAPAAAAPVAVVTTAPAHGAPISAAAPVAATTGVPRASVQAPTVAAPTRPAAAPRPAVISGVSMVDKILAIVAAVVGLAVLARVFMLVS